MKKCGFIILMLAVLMTMGAGYGYAATGAVKAEEPENMILETEDAVTTMAADGLDDIEEVMISKELDGKVKSVGTDCIVVADENGKEMQLLVDAETLIYVNDEKNSLSALQPGDEIFAYFVDENGVLKCDWIEVSR